MTEDEAKQKICPFRHMDGYNFYAPRSPANCLASQCMMWRVETIETQETPQLTTYRFTGHGHCGLIK